MHKARETTEVTVRNYSLSLLTGLTLLFVLSMTWNLYQNRCDSEERARVEARTIFQHNLAYRRWNSSHGGVYSRITDRNPPNPYLGVEQRDLTTIEGTRLTLINPFRMTDQVYGLLREQSPRLAAFNRTVSLKPVNPANRADEWEQRGLKSFEQGVAEVSEITRVDGRAYLRLLTPYVIEASCLDCHDYQGYKVGDIRGGMSISVPLQPYYDAAASSRRIIILTHLLLWLLGGATIVLFSLGLRKYQKEITESKEKFRIVSEFAYNIEFWEGKNGELLFISPSCERITGYSRQEFMENPALLSEIIHPEDQGEYQAHMTDPGAEVHEDEQYRIVTKEGEIRWLSHTCSPIFLEGKFLGRRGSFKDITDKKKLKRQLMQAQKMETLGHFAGGIAHDFNNTLSAITTFTHLLQDELRNAGEEVHEYINCIFVAAKLGENITADLLAFGRKQIGAPRSIDINAIIRNLADLLKTLITEDIDFTLQLAPRELPVFVDPHQIEQVLINLSTNARDAMPDGGRLVIATDFVELEEERPGGLVAIPPGRYVRLAVADAGGGIPPENLPLLFEPFFTTKHPQKGTGLGLAIVYNIVKQHSGYLDLVSQPGQGTTCTIYLPLSTDEIEEPAGQSAEPVVAPGEASQTILLAEDNELVRISIRMLLNQQGYKVLLAENGEEALTRFQAHRDEIDLIVLDVVLPLKNGREVYNSIKQQRPDIKALFISGYTDDIITEKGILDGGLEFLSKPIDKQVFIAKVRAILKNS